jgi:hypothetical protein
MIILSTMLAVAGFLVDRNYVRRKFRVVNALSKLQEILVKPNLNFNDLPNDEISPLIGIVGDSGNKNYIGKGFNQEIFVSYLIYSIVVTGCIGLFIYVMSS